MESLPDVERISPLVVLVDVSTSMRSGDKINELNRAFKEFIKQLGVHEREGGHGRSNKIVHLAVVKFSDSIEVVNFMNSRHGFVRASEVNNDDSNFNFEIKGSETHLGKAVKKALEMLDSFKKNSSQDKDRLCSFYAPTLIIISDGEPNDDGWEAAAETLKERTQKPYTDAHYVRGIFLGVTGYARAAAEKFVYESEPNKFVIDVGANAKDIANMLIVQTLTPPKPSEFVNSNGDRVSTGNQ